MVRSAFILFSVFIINISTVLSAEDSITPVGGYVSGCLQTQIDSERDYRIQKYLFKENGSYIYSIEKYAKAGCVGSKQIEVESGKVKLSGFELNSGMNPYGTRKATFVSKGKSDIGVIWFDKTESKMRISRGTKAFENKLLSVFVYNKVKPLSL